VQGAYRLTRSDGQLIESFVAAPGPMGWRYFAHVHPPGDPEHDLYTVDHVADLEWNLVRFRMAVADGWRAVATRLDGGVEVVHGQADAQRVERFDDAVAVWSSSPSSLLVLHRLAGVEGSIPAVTFDPGANPEPVRVSLRAVGATTASTRGGGSEVQRIRVTVNGRQFESWVRRDLPLRAEGQFELIA
jgi:hypothetical protein